MICYALLGASDSLSRPSLPFLSAGSGRRRPRMASTIPSRPSPLANSLKSLSLPLHKTQRLLPTHNYHTAALPLIPNPITLLRHEQHFRSECRADELSPAQSDLVSGRRFTGCRFVPAGIAPATGDRLQHVSDGGPVLRVEIGVNFVKEVKWRRVALLDGEHEGESAKTWGGY